MTDYSRQILTGDGADDYARYMRVDALLSLQRRPDEVVHRDELLFQVVHQSTELWLKLTCSDIAQAAADIADGKLDAAVELVNRAASATRLLTEQLEMMRFLSPWDFQTIRTVLGHGSGADSPGWRLLRRAARDLERAFSALLADDRIDLVELYLNGVHTPVHRLAEALIEWDERVALWRARHYKVATRVIGHQVRGTQGTPVDVLAGLISHKFFPDLWRVRTELTARGPMGEHNLAGTA